MKYRDSFKLLIMTALSVNAYDPTVIVCRKGYAVHSFNFYWACLQYHVCYVLSDFEVDVVQVVKERKQ